MKSWQMVAIGMMAGLLLSAAVILVAMPPRGIPILLSTPLPPAPISVFVDGAVQKPGLYTLPFQSRVNDAIEMAGGMLPSASTANLNLAARLNDGEKILVQTVKDTPLPKETKPAKLTVSSPQAAATSTPNFPININKANIEDLQLLPGIGEVKARSIITYRQENGPFVTVDDLLNVPGIGSGILSSIKDLVVVADSPQ